MPDSISVHVEGLAEFSAKLESIPLRIARAVLRRGMRAGAAPLREEMQNRVHRRTGFLAEHIGLRISTSGRTDLFATARIGPERVPYPEDDPLAVRVGIASGHKPVTADMVGRFLEFGTRKMSPFPFIRTAFESQKSTALEAFTAASRDAFDEAVY